MGDRPDKAPPPDPDRPRVRAVKLTDREWAELERIARREGREWGGIPNRAEVIRQWIRLHRPR